ncbi:DUF1414 domain-containing protein [Neiella sp. HB171785]|uniref:DUF1414 domain-containing protein n=1 Tax=Neiella litorisoli TaxID=2771431 RepID=A0A8J6UDS7_9GAMM|nr:DUF1414 domain-containing protein [Neiella litorisoli]MBD1388439.1 DUF1414 domain-containing protein [Neiella litorisoli]
MPIQSKYSNQQVESLMAELSQVFSKHQAPIDLELMVLGNMVSQIMAERVPAAQKQVLTEQFCSVLKQAVS